MGNILLVCSVFPPEEVTSAGMSVDLALALSEENNVTVLMPRPSRPAGIDYSGKILEYNEFNCITLKSYTCPYSKILNRFWESVDFGIRSARYIIKHRKSIDYVYNDGWHLFGLYIVARVCKKYKIPYMIPIQDVYPESLFTKGINSPVFQSFVNAILSPLDRYAQKNADVIRTNTNEMAAYLSSTRKIPIDKYLIVYNWQNEDDFKDYKESHSHDRTIFSYVGSINVHSNVDLLIKAFVKADVKNSELRIYGGGNQCETCKNIVKQLGANNVSFDRVSREDVPKIQAEADVMMLALPAGNGRLCLPSKLISYMLSAKPVIASFDTDCDAAKIIYESKCGVVVEPDNLDCLIEGIKQVAYLSLEEKRGMGQRAKEYATTVLSKECNLSKVVSAIDRRLNGKG